MLPYSLATPARCVAVSRYPGSAYRRSTSMATLPSAGDRSASPHGLRPHAVPRVIALEARISENTPRDLRGVRTLARLASAQLPAAPQVIVGRRNPSAHTPSQHPLHHSTP